jgi:hypothetical protein
MGKGVPPFLAHISPSPALALDSSSSSSGKPRWNIAGNPQKCLEDEQELVQVQEKAQDKEQVEGAEHGQADGPKKRGILFCPLSGRGTFRW